MNIMRSFPDVSGAYNGYRAKGNMAFALFCKGATGHPDDRSKDFPRAVPLRDGIIASPSRLPIPPKPANNSLP
ncbi:MAG: hypothetical protein AB7E05_06665 [Sphingobium sp.]